MDDAAFVAFVRDGMDSLKLDAYEVAEALDISVPTVKRWKSGTNLPHPFMRKFVIEYIEKRRTELTG